MQDSTDRKVPPPTRWLYIIGVALFLAGAGCVVWSAYGYQDAKTKANERAAVWDEFNKQLKDNVDQRWAEFRRQVKEQPDQRDEAWDRLWKQRDEYQRGLIEDYVQRLVWLSAPDPFTVIAKRGGAGVFLGCVGFIVILIRRSAGKAWAKSAGS